MEGRRDNEATYGSNTELRGMRSFQAMTCSGRKDV